MEINLHPGESIVINSVGELGQKLTLWVIKDGSLFYTANKSQVPKEFRNDLELENHDHSSSQKSVGSRKLSFEETGSRDSCNRSGDSSLEKSEQESFVLQKSVQNGCGEEFYIGNITKPFTCGERFEDSDEIGFYCDECKELTLCECGHERTNHARELILGQPIKHNECFEEKCECIKFQLPEQDAPNK